MVMGGLGFLVAVVTMVAATIYLTRPDDDSTAAVQPLAGEASLVDASGTGSTLAAPGDTGASIERSRPTLDVAAASANAGVDENLPTTTSSSTTTSTTSTTIATTTTAAPTTTTMVPTSLEEASTTVNADQMSTTSEGTDSSSTSTTPDSTETTVDQGTSTTADQGTTTSSMVATTTGESTTSTTGTPTTTDSGGLNEVEAEILRLTNELRTNPNGPLARQGPVIDCDGNVRLDESGKYEPIGAVEGHLVASLQVARPWSAQMTIDNFQHRPRAGVGALQEAGIEVRAAGENIAYTSYADKAQRFFTGWRESDGHFCNMMNPNYTHLGVGEVTKPDQGFNVSFATQNFFAIR